MEPLSIVSFAYAQFMGDMNLVQALAAMVMGEYENAGAAGQGANFPLFTQRYLKQSTRSKMPPEIFEWFRDCCQSYLNARRRILISASLQRRSIRFGRTSTGLANTTLPIITAWAIRAVRRVFRQRAIGFEGGYRRVADFERTLLPSIEARFEMVYRSSEKVQIKPMPGWLVLFPPFVRHYVTPHLSNQPRISVAFNVLSSAIIGPK